MKARKILKSDLRILYLTASWPHGRTFGGQLRTLHIGRALQKLGAVTIGVVSADAPLPGALEKTAEEFDVHPAIQVHSLRNRGISGRIRWAFDSKYLNIHGCVAEDADRERLLSRLSEFDLIWLSNSRTPNILNLWRWPKSVLDIDDVPSTYQRTIWQNGAGLKEKFKAGMTMHLFKRREEFWKRRFNALSVCSESDRAYLGGGEHVHVIPNGFESPAQEPVRNPVLPPRVGFIGLYSYPPNLEGMKWFVRECWPQLKQQIPDARLRLVGKDSDGPLKPYAPDVDALGYVADPAAEIASWSIMIAPVLHGAGTRVKIADAFSRKCPVVSTTLGALGYEVQSGRELMLADTPADFANGCASLIQNPERAKAMAECAFSAFQEKWTWNAIAPRIQAVAEDALRNHSLSDMPF